MLGNTTQAAVFETNELHSNQYYNVLKLTSQ